MPKVLIALVAALLATVVVVAGVISNRSPSETEPPAPAYASIPLATYDTDGVAVSRDSFCAGVPDEAVAEAVEGDAESTTSYDNGDRTRLEDGLRDVAHEFGCTWATPDATARAWVFAPPVTPRSARQLARELRQQPDCEPVARAADFGKPSAALVCEVGDRLEASYRGLFGDAWLTCVVSTGSDVSRTELTDRAGRWCVAVLEAART